MTSKTISCGEDIMGVGRGTHFIRVEDQDDNYYWITAGWTTQELNFQFESTEIL